MYKNKIDKELEEFDLGEDTDTDDSFIEQKKEIKSPKTPPIPLEDDLLDNDANFNNFSDEFGIPQGNPMDKHNDLLKELTNFDPFIKDKYNNWLGITWDEEQSKYIKNPNLYPIMNVKCATWCLGFLIVYARKNNIITDLDKDTYKFLISDIIDVLWTSLGSRCEDFNITNNADLKRICVEMEHSATLVLVGAGGGKYNKFLSTTTSRQENINSTAQPVINNNYNTQTKKKGVLERLKTMIGG